jgi:hypothetical protein
MQAHTQTTSEHTSMTAVGARDITTGGARNALA